MVIDGRVIKILFELLLKMVNKFLFYECCFLERPKDHEKIC